jgi:dTDP-glucose 4,6-dehydratase
MKSGPAGETYNVGGGSEMENITVVRMICDMIDEISASPGGKSRRDLITFVKDRPGHDRRYAMDFSKLNRELDWRPKESFRSGLQKTIHWYLDNREWIQRVRIGEYQSWLKEQYG